MPDSDRKPLFVECTPCGARWKIGELPRMLSLMARLGSQTCPNCGERKRIVVCYTDGPNAVSEPREGREIVDAD